mmetsp:Transcript_7433/g.12931  ORF Transcript_7433/g.12931 Transcript_7433/m.12931 type:complete len:133 (-) Transcript_7433:380-778(-)
MLMNPAVTWQTASSLQVFVEDASSASPSHLKRRSRHVAQSCGYVQKVQGFLCIAGLRSPQGSNDNKRVLHVPTAPQQQSQLFKQRPFGRRRSAFTDAEHCSDASHSNFLPSPVNNAEELPCTCGSVKPGYGP